MTAQHELRPKLTGESAKLDAGSRKWQRYETHIGTSKGPWTEHAEEGHVEQPLHCMACSRLLTWSLSAKGFSRAHFTLEAMKSRMLEVEPTTPMSRVFLASIASVNISPGTCTRSSVSGIHSLRGQTEHAQSDTITHIRIWNVKLYQHCPFGLLKIEVQTGAVSFTARQQCKRETLLLGRARVFHNRRHTSCWSNMPLATTGHSLMHPKLPVLQKLPVLLEQCTLGAMHSWWQAALQNDSNDCTNRTLATHCYQAFSLGVCHQDDDEDKGRRAVLPQSVQ